MRKRYLATLISAVVLTSAVAHIASASTTTDWRTALSDLGIQNSATATASSASSTGSARATINFSATQGSEVESYWKGLLVAAAASQNPDLHAASICTPAEGCSSTSLDDQQAVGGKLTDSQATSLIQQNAAGMGLNLLSLTIYHPAGAGQAIGAVVQAADPTKWLQLGRGDTASRLLGGDLNQFTGTFVRMVDASGNVVFETGWCTPLRAGVGRIGDAYSSWDSTG